MFIKLEIYLSYYEFDKITKSISYWLQRKKQTRKLTQDIPQEKMHIILGTWIQGNWIGN